LTPEERLQVHTEIHQLCYHGGGGFTLGDVYDLPVYLRRFHLRKLIETKEHQRDVARGGEDVKAKPTTARVKRPPKPA
jgi:hypothetical protein